MAASLVGRRLIQKAGKWPWRLHTRTTSSTTDGKYFIFIPEVPADTRENNAIMRYDEFPKYTEMDSNSIIRGCAKLALTYDHALDNMIEELSDQSNDVDFDKIFKTVEEAIAPVTYAEKTMNVLMITDVEKFPKALGQRVYSQTVRSKNDRFMDAVLYNRLKELNAGRQNLTDLQKRLLDIYLIECKYGGQGLGEKGKKLYTDCNKKLRKDEDDFLSKTMAVSSRFHHDLSPDEWQVVRPLPMHARLSISLDKKNPDRGPWRLSLQDYLYQLIMQTCARQDLRRLMWRGRNMLCSHLTTDVRYATFEIIDEIRYARKRLAKCLGYDHYCDLMMERKMAGNVDTVLSMLDTYGKFYQPIAAKELKDLQDFADSCGIISRLEPWDIEYYRFQQNEQLYGVSAITKSPYFSLPNVLDTIFETCGTLFNITFKEVNKSEVDVWHQDVTVYDVYDKDGTYMARLYMDLYHRHITKAIHFKVESGRDRCDLLGMTPISYLLASLPKPRQDGVPTLISFTEVLKLFFEFGRALQQMLTTVPLIELAGQANIEVDAVDVPSHLMQMVAMEPSIIKSMSAHYLTEELLTDTQINNLIKSVRHMEAFDMCYQLYYSAFDIECHLDNETFWRDIQSEMHKMFMPMPRHQDDWSFCGDATLWYSNILAASYYSQIWSKMLAANVFEEFQAAGFDNKKQVAKVGKRFRDTYLSLGGSVDAMTVFRQFKGCNPSLDSLIKQYEQARETS